MGLGVVDGTRGEVEQGANGLPCIHNRIVEEIFIETDVIRLAMPTATFLDESVRRIMPGKSVLIHARITRWPPESTVPSEVTRCNAPLFGLSTHFSPVLHFFRRPKARGYTSILPARPGGGGTLDPEACKFSGRVEARDHEEGGDGGPGSAEGDIGGLDVGCPCPT